MSYGMSTRDFQGDPFLGGLIKTAFKGIKGAIGGVFGGPSPISILPPQLPTPVLPGGTTVRGITVKPKPGVRGAVERLLPGGKTGYVVEGRRRRRINPANPKALRRAIRRTDGFVKLARRALKGSGYTIVSRSSRRPKRDLGRGHIHVR